MAKGLTGDDALAIAKSYVRQSLAGAGALKGKNCTIQSITEVTGGSEIVFAWALDDGTAQTSTLFIPYPIITVERAAADDGAVITTTNPDGTTSEAEVKDGRNFPTSATIPTDAGAVGDIVFNSAPEPGGWIGWVYTPTGWYGFGAIGITDADVPETAFLTADGLPFTLSDGSIFLYADS